MHHHGSNSSPSNDGVRIPHCFWTQHPGQRTSAVAVESARQPDDAVGFRYVINPTEQEVFNLVLGFDIRDVAAIQIQPARVGIPGQRIAMRTRRPCAKRDAPWTALGHSVTPDIGGARWRLSEGEQLRSSEKKASCRSRSTGSRSTGLAPSSQLPPSHRVKGQYSLAQCA